MGIGPDSEFFSEQNWLCDNLKSVSREMHESLSLKFGVILDILWWRRNELIFSNKFIDSFKIKDKALATARGIMESFYTMSNMNIVMLGYLWMRLGSYLRNRIGLL
jgi:hypothetical protein